MTAYSVHLGIIISNHDASMVGPIACIAMKVTPTITATDGARASLFCATNPDAPALAGFPLHLFEEVIARE